MQIRNISSSIYEEMFLEENCIILFFSSIYFVSVLSRFVYVRGCASSFETFRNFSAREKYLNLGGESARRQAMYVL